MINRGFVLCPLFHDGGTMRQKAGHIIASPSDIKKHGTVVFQSTEIVWEDMEFWTDLLSVESQQFIDWDIAYKENKESIQVVRATGDVERVKLAVQKLLPIIDLLVNHTYTLRMFAPSFNQQTKRIKQ